MEQLTLQEARPPRPPTKQLLTLFDSLHQEVLTTRAHFSIKKDAALLSKLWTMRQNDSVTVEHLIAEFFREPTAFTKSAGFTVGVFYSQIGKLLLQIAARKQNDSRGEWWDECKRIHGGRCNGQYIHWLRTPK